jgi:transcriptional regulator with XRE-family HTH domain
MPRRPSRSAQQVSPLRQARLAQNWTLERLAEEIDLRTPGGHSGVTPSMVSGWELGRHITSIGHRRTLCDIYAQPPDVLFAHQDQSLTAGAALQLLAGSVTCSRRCWPPSLPPTTSPTTSTRAACQRPPGRRIRPEARRARSLPTHAPGAIYSQPARQIAGHWWLRLVR